MLRRASLLHAFGCQCAAAAAVCSRWPTIDHRFAITARRSNPVAEELRGPRIMEPRPKRGKCVLLDCTGSSLSRNELPRYRSRAPWSPVRHAHGECLFNALGYCARAVALVSNRSLKLEHCRAVAAAMSVREMRAASGTQVACAQVACPPSCKPVGLCFAKAASGMLVPTNTTHAEHGSMPRPLRRQGEALHEHKQQHEHMPISPTSSTQPASRRSGTNRLHLRRHHRLLLHVVATAARLPGP